MRIRKKKWALPYLETRTNDLISDPSIYKGSWKKLLNTDILHLEIGSGKGTYFIEMSKLYPNEGFIALEKSLDVMAICLKKMDPLLPNMKAICNDAELLNEWFDLKELDYIHLNFSDPWPKKHHHKRRLTSSRFNKLYYDLLNDEGRVIMKTDNLELFEYSLESMEQYFDLISKDYDFRSKSHPEDVITEYEQNFINLNQPIYRAIWRKK